MEWWMLYAYNLDAGNRAILGVVNSPFKPSDRSPFYFERPIKTKWVKCFEADIASGNFEIKVRVKDWK